MKCHQCDKPACYSNGIPGQGELLLCLDCQLKFTQISEAKQAALTRSLNFQMSMLESRTGIPLPRHPEPKPKTQYTMQNIDLQGANVGIVNTGTIKELSGSVSVIADSGNKQLSAALIDFLQAVLHTQSVEAEQREAILERVAFIAQQASKPASERSKRMLPSVILEVGTLVSSVEALSALYGRHLKPLLEALLQ
jgi:hypothetical protein